MSYLKKRNSFLTILILHVRLPISVIVFLTNIRSYIYVQYMNDEFDKIELSSQLNERRDLYNLRKINSLTHKLRREIANDSESI